MAMAMAGSGLGGAGVSHTWQCPSPPAWPFGCRPPCQHEPLPVYLPPLRRRYCLRGGLDLRCDQREVRGAARRPAALPWPGKRSKHEL